MTEAEIAEALDRSPAAVHLRWSRDLALTAPTKREDWLTASGAADLLGFDKHVVANWCDAGLLPHRLVAGARRVRLIYRTTLDRWIVSPANWIYFDPKRIKDARLRRLCELRARRWGDEWLPTAEVARMLNTSTKHIEEQIKRGQLYGVQGITSRAGRSRLPAVSLKNTLLS